jgi:hypothetical protein
MQNANSRDQLAGAVAAAASAVADVLGTHQLRPGVPYPIAEVLPVLIEQHRNLQELTDAWSGPLAVDENGKPDPLAGELAGFISYLQLFRVLYRGLDEIPDALRVTAGRNLATLYQAARKLRTRR